MRKSGILLHISSLPSPYGIGSYGKAAYEFVDFLNQSKQSIWQILPLGPTSYGDSPYQTFSAFANNPYFIDLDILVEEGLLLKEEIIDDTSNKAYVEYEDLYQHRFNILSKAFERFNRKNEDYLKFLNAQAFWLDDYALFMSIKSSYDGKSWLYWDEDVRLRKQSSLDKLRKDLKDDIEFHKFMQFKSDEQWHNLKTYANSKGIEMMGDMPIYVSYDSSDVWANPKMFDLDEKNIPYHVAGVPPDNYSADGQLWGNPLYHWKHLKETDYKWWVSRVQSAMNLFDMIRIDHFIGFVNYFSIPYGDKNARQGEWKKGPGYELFKVIQKELGDVNIIAEDLGVVTEEVRKVLKETGYPGMKLLQFGFDSNESNEYLPHYYDENVFAYTGTHDNLTTAAWFKSLPKKDLKYCLKYLKCNIFKNRVDCLIKATLNSKAKSAIIPMQDYLHLGAEARMNMPSTLGNNWKWRVLESDLTPKLAMKIAAWVQASNR